MKWIKTSEREPDISGEYFTRMSVGSIDAQVKKVVSVFTKEEYQRSHWSGSFDWNYVIEWLEDVEFASRLSLSSIKEMEGNKLNECYFTPSIRNSSATICEICGKEKMLHTIGQGIKAVTKQDIMPVSVSSEHIESIEREAIGALKETEKFTTLCTTEDEENIFIQGFISGMLEEIRFKNNNLNGKERQ